MIKDIKLLRKFLNNLSLTVAYPPNAFKFYYQMFRVK